MDYIRSPIWARLQGPIQKPLRSARLLESFRAVPLRAVPLGLGGSRSRMQGNMRPYWGHVVLAYVPFLGLRPSNH